jgi:uncharacterized protein YgbK (DUF1537 family)
MAIGPLVVLDDDPTGTQSLAGAQVVCEVSEAAIAEAARSRPASLHVLTNSRALDPDGAYAVTREAAAAARAVLPGARVILRGDSTLRAHVREEYLALVEALHGGAFVPLVLVPALPAAGRVTRDGEHLLVGPDGAVPLSQTEYAADPDLGYSTSRLLAWAEERTGGLLPASRGVVVPLAGLRSDGPRAVVEAVSRAPAAVAVDAETEEDLEVIAAGLERSGACCVRCAPTLVGALAGNTARDLIVPRPVRDGTLVVCGSWVPLAARQLAVLEREHPGASVFVDPVALLTGDKELERAARACRQRIAEHGIAIVSTPRERQPRLDRERLAVRLAGVVRAVAGSVGAVVSKGGITSAVTARVGLGASRAEVAGPVAPGVALWVPADGPHAGMPLAVVPGNVGDDRLILDVVTRLHAVGEERAGAGTVR